jgi:hypothetical protein
MIDRARARALCAAAVVSAVLALTTGCGAAGGAEPTPVPTPTRFDPSAAAEIRDGGNGLWLLDGVAAAGEVVDAARRGGAVAMTASVREQTLDADGDPVPGRTIAVERTGTPDAYRAVFSLGDQSGEAVVIGSGAWVRGNPALAQRYGLPADGSFACVSARDSLLTDLATVLDPAEFVRAALLGLELGTLPPAAGADRQTLVVGKGGAPVGTLEAAVQGPPLPLSLTTADVTGGVSAAFAWGEAAPATAPEGAPACG